MADGARIVNPHYLVETPRIISQLIDEDDWAELGEMKVE